MQTITSIGSDLWIYDNEVLADIAGLANIAPASINDLNVYNNPLLSDCDISSICEYLLSPGGVVNIYNNAPGCNSPEEVEEACLIAVEETDVENQISLFPNPADKTISILTNGGPEIQEVSISNHLGQVILQGKPVNNFIDVSTLQPGVYFIQIISNQSKTIRKLIIH